MTPELNDASKAFWQNIHAKKKHYPFWCRTSSLAPRPELVSDTPFYRITYEGFAYWGFPTSEKRNLFQSAYSAENWSP